MYVQNVIRDNSCASFSNNYCSSASPKALFERTRDYVYVVNDNIIKVDKKENPVLQNNSLIDEGK